MLSTLRGSGQDAPATWQEPSAAAPVATGPPPDSSLAHERPVPMSDEDIQIPAAESAQGGDLPPSTPVSPAPAARPGPPTPAPASGPSAAGPLFASSPAEDATFTPPKNFFGGDVYSACQRWLRQSTSACLLAHVHLTLPRRRGQDRGLRFQRGGLVPHDHHVPLLREGQNLPEQRASSRRPVSPHRCLRYLSAYRHHRNPEGRALSWRYAPGRLQDDLNCRPRRVPWDRQTYK